MDLAAQSELPLHHHISNPPYENYFFADQSVSCQAVLSSPTPNFVPGSLSTHRLLFAWPAGNSGAAVFFKAVTKQDSLCITYIPGADGRIRDLVKYEAKLSFAISKRWSLRSCEILGQSYLGLSYPR